MNQAHEAVVSRLVKEVICGGDLEVLDQLYTPRLAAAARKWIEPFLQSFPDVQMEIVQFVSDGEMVVGRFRCSATHLAAWMGHPPTGRRFEAVDEVSIFTFNGGLIDQVWGIEDNLERFRQLGLTP